ncbi:MAG: hypothetical protein DRJ52_00185 [Thermoprotei archaeon]|nr:MAG: hypothetical protein DRJ52_00185 [Thermoprotei archaeon]RLF00970.1 MAG: hypothetical protein DRJ63_01005 [Thermoprotei archaeon]HDI74489.1 hypothetical protein [Thermoprotei archaeon]
MSVKKKHYLHEVQSTRPYLDKDYIQAGRLIACVVGYLHPLAKVISFPKYLVAEKGKSVWKREGKVYIRLIKTYSIQEISKSIEMAEELFREYVYYDKVLGCKVVGIPIICIDEHYMPEKRLGELLKEKNLSNLESIAVELAKELSSRSNIPLKSLGVTGSILLKIHNERFSDINLVIYGLRESWKVLDVLKNMDISKCDKEWVNKIIKVYNVPPETAKEIYRRKVDKGVFLNKNFSVSFVRKPEEVREKYGEKVYRVIGRIELKAVILDPVESLFFPYTYKIKPLNVSHIFRESLKELVCFNGVYSGIFSEEEKVVINGVLVEVKSSGEKTYQVAVGSREHPGFIKLLK